MKFASRIIKTTLLIGMCSNMKFVHHPSKVLKEILRGRISFLRPVAKKGNELARTVVTEGLCSFIPVQDAYQESQKLRVTLFGQHLAKGTYNATRPDDDKYAHRRVMEFQDRTFFTPRQCW